MVYYQATRGRRKLVTDYADDYDVEHYVRKLTETYAGRLAEAIPPEHWAALFSEQLSLFTTPLITIRPQLTEEITVADAVARMA